MRINRPGEPSYAGGATFSKVPLVLDPDGLSGADVAIVGAPMDELVTNRPGARFGPRAIRLATDESGPPKTWHLDLGVDPFADLAIVDHGDAAVIPGDPHASHRAIRDAVARVAEAGAVPIVLGGDHSIAYPDLSAVAATRDEPPAVVHFDAHADTATDNWGVKWAHGTPFRNLVQDGVIDAGRLVQLGLRGYWPHRAEFDWMRSVGVRWHRMDEIADRGLDAVLDAVLDVLAGGPPVYLSVDVDVLDPAYAPGTGTPEPGGMTTRELLTAIRRIALEHDLAGIDVVEVSPPYDPSGITALAAHRCVLEALSAMAVRRRGGRASPEDPT